MPIARIYLQLIAFSLAVCATPVALYAASEQSVPTRNASEIDWQTSPLDLDLRGMNGEHYLFACPPGKPVPSRVIGSGPYTDDSSICSAAAHAGQIHPKDGGKVAIEIRPGQAIYTGSEQYFIKSTDYDHPWSGSFLVIRSDAGSSP